MLCYGLRNSGHGTAAGTSNSLSSRSSSSPGCGNKSPYPRSSLGAWNSCRDVRELPVRCVRTGTCRDGGLQTHQGLAIAQAATRVVLVESYYRAEVMVFINETIWIQLRVESLIASVHLQESTAATGSSFANGSLPSRVNARAIHARVHSTLAIHTWKRAKSEGVPP